MRIGDLDQWAVHRLNARIFELGGHLQVMANQATEVDDFLEGMRVEDVVALLNRLEGGIDVAADDVRYIRERLNTAVLIQTDEDPE